MHLGRVRHLQRYYHCALSLSAGSSLSFSEGRNHWINITASRIIPSRMSTMTHDDTGVTRQRKATGVVTRTLHTSHTHSHSSHHGGHGGHTHGGHEETQALVSALSGSADPGSRITLIGLGANVGLTLTKGAAGWVMGSAALLADAAHSGSDLLADIVTLTTYRISRRPISATHPFGYGSEYYVCVSSPPRQRCMLKGLICTEYESLGSLVVSFLLIGTAVGIGTAHGTSQTVHHADTDSFYYLQAFIRIICS